MDCCCGVRDFEPCSVCGCCINDECDCTKQDRVIAEMQQDIINLRENCQTLRNRIDTLEQKNVMSLYPTKKDVEDRYNARNEEEEN